MDRGDVRMIERGRRFRFRPRQSSRRCGNERECCWLTVLES
jgi:hypothetical protein